MRVGLLIADSARGHGPGQSEVTTLRRLAARNHWRTLVKEKVTPADAVAEAHDLCSQRVDLVIIGEGELAGAEAAASSSTCNGTPFWVFASGTSVPASPYVYLAATMPDLQDYATGVAMGLWLKKHHATAAGFLAGTAVSATERAGQATLAGMRSVVPDATLDADFTGSVVSPGPALGAARALLAEGATLIDTYIGNVGFPVAKFIVGHGGATLSGGIDACVTDGVHFAIRQAFDPGPFLALALDEFAHGTMRVGVTRTFPLKATSPPTVAFCPSAHISAAAKDRLATALRGLVAGTLTVTLAINKTPAPS